MPFDDVLNVRSSPGTGHAVVGTLEPTEERVVATGDAMLLERSIWWRVTYPVSGWVNARYLAAAGSTEDATAAVIEAAGTIPSADSLDDLARQVIETMWLPSDVEGEVIIVQAPGIAGDIGDIVVDVLPAEPDDAVRGIRLAVFGQLDGASGPLALYAVEATSLCWRGADGAGLCV
ncbi:MAG: SH3 domain-containing protein [Acidimicrobiia bacterium]|nr:SH3 domain-containing protein [Acidimicrobiia bacterium]